MSDTKLTDENIALVEQGDHRIKLNSKMQNQKMDYYYLITCLEFKFTKIAADNFGHLHVNIMAHKALMVMLYKSCIGLYQSMGTMRTRLGDVCGRPCDDYADK